MMKFTEKQIDLLRHEVGKKLSNKRFMHTLGVEKMAVLIGEKILPDLVDKIRVAALLHDISKEYSEAEHLDIVKRHNLLMTDEDIATPPLWHSITAPGAVKDEFPEYADSEVLSAVSNHTVGSPDMSVFDEIILLSDYIEEGRSYKNCIDVREMFLSELEMANSKEECVSALHRAVALSLDNNIKEFVSRGQSFHGRTKATRDAILEKIER